MLDNWDMEIFTTVNTPVGVSGLWLSSIMWTSAPKAYIAPLYPTQKKPSVVFSPQANYTDWATTTCRRNLVPTSADRGVRRGQRWGSLTVVNLSFLDRSRYIFQVTPHLSSRGWVDPVPDPLLLRKSGSAGNRTRDLWVCNQEVWPLEHKGGLYPSTEMQDVFRNNSANIPVPSDTFPPHRVRVQNGGVTASCSLTSQLTLSLNCLVTAKSAYARYHVTPVFLTVFSPGAPKVRGTTAWVNSWVVTGETFLKCFPLLKAVHLW
jgi:hypothetical protein